MGNKQVLLLEQVGLTQNWRSSTCYHTHMHGGKVEERDGKVRHTKLERTPWQHNVKWMHWQEYRVLRNEFCAKPVLKNSVQGLGTKAVRLDSEALAPKLVQHKRQQPAALPPASDHDLSRGRPRWTVVWVVVAIPPVCAILFRSVVTNPCAAHTLTLRCLALVHSNSVRAWSAA